ncbi:I78 family peptidase inhibitor [Rhizobium halophilum]|uniref:I78 family peptidase inhibitor n=1 Tax=Rhizobium halophilum TaxID=2846852 RepID=UPI001EFDD4C7|nr:I78 family peptidase inhibitor [Rhizobium halophilum]MCF6371154.1 hypothetical protein [Rhizobium halophilum]
MRTPSCFVLSVAVGLAWASIGCSADGAPTSQPQGPCDAQATQGLVGKTKPTDEAAKRLTGAKTVRQIKPGDMVTQDFREDRVTIETDPASGLVTRATCG